MPEKKATYRIDENMLRNTLLNYTVEVDAAQCSVIEQEASAIRMQKAFVMPETKVLVKFVAIPLLLIGTAILVYANMESIQSAFTPSPQPAAQTEKKVVVPPPVIKTATVATVYNTPPPVVNTVVAKRDTVMATAKKPDPATQQISKKAVPVIAGPPTDSAATTKPENILKTNKTDTASQKTEAPVKKKKKRRRRSDAYIEDVKENSLQPNSADDDVVVPQ